MNTFRKLISAFVLSLLFVAVCAQAQTGHYGTHVVPRSPNSGSRIHSDVENNYTSDPAVQPISGAHIYLWDYGIHGDGTAGYSLIDCSLSGNGTVYGPDGNGNCYVISDSGGLYNVSNDYTDYYDQCSADDDLVYLVAVGGQRLYSGTPTLNPLIANIAVSPVTCVDLTSEDYFNVSDLSTVAAAYTLAPFANSATTQADDFATKGNPGSTNANALLTAFQSANNLVSVITNTYAAAYGSGVNSTAQETMNTIADVLVACMVTSGSTSSGTPCGSLFGYATAPNLLSGGTYTPTDLWLTALYMVENPTSNGNIASEYGLIASASNPAWSPTYSSSSALPTSWDIENSSSTSLGGPVISNLIPPGAGQVGYATGAEGSTLYVNGTNLVGSCSGSPIVVVDGIVATVTSSSQTELTATIASTYSLNSNHQFQGYVGVYSCGYASNFIPFIVTLH